MVSVSCPSESSISDETSHGETDLLVQNEVFTVPVISWYDRKGQKINLCATVKGKINLCANDESLQFLPHAS